VALQHEGELELARLEEKRLAEEEARHLNATSSASNGVQRTCPIHEICDQAVKAPAGTVSTRYPESDPEQTGSVSVWTCPGWRKVQRMAVQSAEHHRDCGELESMPNILFNCVHREDIRYVLRDSCTSLEEKIP
jgi:hypothetical protein